jgi:hypothetical protein
MDIENWIKTRFQCDNKCFTHSRQR